MSELGIYSTHIKQMEVRGVQQFFAQSITFKEALRGISIDKTKINYPIFLECLHHEVYVVSRNHDLLLAIFHVFGCSMGIEHHLFLITPHPSAIS